MKNKMLIVIILLMLLVTACAVTPDTKPERSYVGADVTYSEPMAQYGFRLNMDSAEGEFAKYFFEASIADQEREACTGVTEKVLANQTYGDVKPEIYVFSQERYEYKYLDGHKLYTSPENWESVDYITDILLVAYGEAAHYGAAFGYANYLAETLQWENQSGKFSAPGETAILDLSYLCFDENFATTEDVVTAKEVACAFVVSYINRNGEQAFQQLLSSCAKAIDALAVYYRENGVSYTPTAIPYQYGGKTYDYIVRSDYGTFYIENDWVDINTEYNPLITDGFLHSNYADTKAFFETNLKQMKQYQDLFMLDDYNHDLDIVFTQPIGLSKTSFYQGANHRIYLYNVDSMMHEYIHALSMPTPSMQNWQVEGFARYFSYYYDFYGMAFLNQDYNNTPDTPELRYVHEYLAAINRPIDMAKDYREIENVAVHYFGFTNPNKNYLAGSSFVQYLVKQYGEEAVINSIYGNCNPLPKTYAELVKEWDEYIAREYKEYSKYQQ